MFGRQRIAFIILLGLASAPSAMASTNMTRQGHELVWLAWAAHLYINEHNVAPITDSQGTWFQKLVDDKLIDPQRDLRFGLSPGGQFPLDCYGHPVIFEPPSSANDNQPVMRSMGANGIDDHGALDDWDTRFGPHYPYWYMQRWPAAYLRAKWCAAAAVLGTIAIIVILWRRRRWMAKALMMWLGSIGAFGLPYGFDSGADHIPPNRDAMLFRLGVLAGVALLAAGLVAVLRDAWTRYCISRVPRLGECRRCHYDLRGTIASGGSTCPECGLEFRPEPRLPN